MKNKIDFELLPWENVTKGLRVKSIIESEKKIRYAEFSQEFAEVDWCLKGHLGYVIEGKLEINFNGNIIQYKDNDGIVIPAGEEYKHKTKVITNKAIVFLIEDL